MTALRPPADDERVESVDHLAEHLLHTWRGFDAARPDQPEVSAQTRALLAEPAPVEGVGVLAAVDAAAHVLDESLAQSRPRYFGYVGSSGLESAVIAEALAVSHDVNLAAECGAAEDVERQVISWVADFVGYPCSGGTVTSGGMLSNLTALAAARSRAVPDARAQGIGNRRLAVYVSCEAHSSIERSVEILGLGTAALRPIEVDASHRMSTAALRARIHSDVEDGITPMAVVATAGTTLTGAVDPIGEIAEACAEVDAWLHVDGAYGLPAASTTLAAGLFKGLALADSATVDAHKWMYVPKACSILMLRDATWLRQTFAHHSAYMLDKSTRGLPVDQTLEYSRPFRALKLWTAIRAHGLDAFREAIAGNLLSAQVLAQAVREHPDFELAFDPVDLSVVPFRRIPAAGDPSVHNAELVRAIQADGRVYVTSAQIDGQTFLRPCITNYRTTTDDALTLLHIADELGRQLDA